MLNMISGVLLMLLGARLICTAAVVQTDEWHYGVAGIALFIAGLHLIF